LLLVRDALTDVGEASSGAANNDDSCGRYVAIPTTEQAMRWICAMDPRDEKEA
jgi:hypothetical protein